MLWDLWLSFLACYLFYIIKGFSALEKQRWTGILQETSVPNIPFSLISGSFQRGYLCCTDSRWTNLTSSLGLRDKMPRKSVAWIEILAEEQKKLGVKLFVKVLARTAKIIAPTVCGRYLVRATWLGVGACFKIRQYILDANHVLRYNRWVHLGRAFERSTCFLKRCDCTYPKINVEFNLYFIFHHYYLVPVTNQYDCNHACYDRGSTFRLKWFLNEGAPYLAKKNGRK